MPSELVINENEVLSDVAYNIRHVKSSKIMSEAYYKSSVVLQELEGIKMLKNGALYAVVDKRRDLVWAYKNARWAQRKYERMIAVFTRV